MYKKMILIFAVLFCLFAVACKTEEKTELLSVFPLEDTKALAPTAILITLQEESNSFPYSIAVHFKQTLEALSEGTVVVDVLPDSELGGTEYADDMLADGRVQMRLGIGPSKLMKMLAMPSVSQATPETVYSAFDEPAWCALINEECARYGVRFLSIALAEYLIVTSSEPITDVSGFRDLRMRCIGDGSAQAAWAPFGVTLVSIENDRITAAVSSGVVDTVTDITLADYLIYRRYLQQPYVAETHQGLDIHSFYINDAFYNTLSERDRKLIERAVTETVRWTQTVSVERLAPMIAEAEKNGMQVTTFTREALHTMYTRNTDSVCAYLEDYLGSEAMQAGLAALRYVSPKS